MTSAEWTPATILAAARDSGEAGYDPFEAFDEAMGSAVDSPYPVYGELLSECPVHAGSQSHRFGETTMSADDMMGAGRPQFNAYSFTAVESVLRDGDAFSSVGYDETIALVMGRTILGMDEPEHGRYRKLIQQAFTKKQMDRWEVDYVEPLVNWYIDAFAERGRADLVTEFTFMYPVHVIATAIGLPIGELPWFYRSAVEITNLTGAPERGYLAAQNLYGRLKELIDDRRHSPADDLIGVLVSASFPDTDGSGAEALTDDEIIAFIRLLLPAGAETTYRSTSNLLFGLLTHPDQLAAVRSDRSLVPQAIEEAVRWEPPLTSISRRATRDVELDGVAVPSGAQIAVCMGAANHDPTRYDRPDEFDIFRTAKGHMSFASGPHLCLGIHLARMEMRVALEAVLDRLPNLRLDPDAEAPQIKGLGFRAPHHLPVVFDA